MMETLLHLFSALVIIGALAYFRTPLWLWTVLLAVLLAVSGYLIPVTWEMVLEWAVFIAVALLLNVRPLRRRLISDRVLRLFRRIMPAMSQTERDALEAGTVWWEGELFGGRPDWDRFFAFKPPQLTPEEQAFIDGPVEHLCQMLDDWRITEEHHDLPPEVWQFLKDQRLFGMIIPRRYGGLEFSALAHSTVVMKLASRSVSAAVTVMVPNSLGPAELLLHYGSDAQKDYYLPRLARGEEVPCFALTGPEAGSDASAIPDKGVICRGQYQGREITGIRLNWDKRYITLGPVATVLGLAFKLYDPDHLLGDKDDLGITLALIPTDTPGITIGNRHSPLDQVFQNGPNQGRDVFIPLDWIIGGPALHGARVAYADGEPRRRPCHLAARPERRGGQAGMPRHRRLCPHPPPVQDAHRLLRGRGGGLGGHGRLYLYDGCGADDDRRRGGQRGTPGGGVGHGEIQPHGAHAPGGQSWPWMCRAAAASAWVRAIFSVGSIRPSPSASPWRAPISLPAA